MSPTPKILRSDPVGLASWDFRSPLRSTLAVALLVLATAVSLAHAAM
jgi:hypothetical protein